jgi:hypothetical protein
MKFRGWFQIWMLAAAGALTMFVISGSYRTGLTCLNGQIQIVSKKGALEIFGGRADISNWRDGFSHTSWRSLFPSETIADFESLSLDFAEPPFRIFPIAFSVFNHGFDDPGLGFDTPDRSFINSFIFPFYFVIPWLGIFIVLVLISLLPVLRRKFTSDA